MNDFKDTNFEAADRKSVMSILDTSDEFMPVEKVEESDFRLDEEVKRELDVFRERRELIAA
jgi:hypothetical protein